MVSLFSLKRFFYGSDYINIHILGCLCLSHLFFFILSCLHLCIPFVCMGCWVWHTIVWMSEGSFWELLLSGLVASVFTWWAIHLWPNTVHISLLCFLFVCLFVFAFSNSQASGVVCLVFWGRVSPWPRAYQLMLGWLASEYQIPVSAFTNWATQPLLCLTPSWILNDKE